MQHNNSLTQIPCPACGTLLAKTLEEIDLDEEFSLYFPNDKEKIDRLKPLSALDVSSYSINLCNQCSLTYSTPMKGAASPWYEFVYLKLDFHASYRWEFDHVIDNVDTGLSVGEIGCGTGIFLDACQKKKLPARGVDFANASVNICLTKGLDAVALSVETDYSEFIANDKRDVIASFHVLEHLENPNSLFELANLWSKPEATLWVAVPSDTRIDRLLGKKDIFDEPPHHLTKWSKESLRVIGEKNGWEMLELIYETRPFRQRLYDLLVEKRGNNETPSLSNHPTLGKWLDRISRYAQYPWLYINNKAIVDSITGHSMLVRYRKLKQ